MLTWSEIATMRLYKVQHISAICGSILYSAAFEFGLYTERKIYSRLSEFSGTPA